MNDIKIRVKNKYYNIFYKYYKKYFKAYDFNCIRLHEKYHVNTPHTIFHIKKDTLSYCKDDEEFKKTTCFCCDRNCNSILNFHQILREEKLKKILTT